MKIVHVITAFGLGGAERLLVDVINQQILKHEVYLLYLKSPEDLIHVLDKRVEVKKIKLSFFTSRALSKYFKVINPEIIHTHLGHADILGIWSSRNLKAKIFCTMHNVHIQQNILDQIYFKVYKFLFNTAASQIKVISISKSVETHVLNTLKVPQKRSFLLYNAISQKPLSNKNGQLLKTSNSKKPITFLFVGRLVKQKSVATFIKAMQILKEAGYANKINAFIVGDGDLRNKLENLSRELKVDDIVNFEGKKIDVQHYYEMANVFVLPSIWEGFGIVILEAFRAKLAIIASNIEGPSELIINNKNGLLFAPNNHHEMADKMKLLIESEVLRHQLSENGFISFNEKYHINKYVSTLNALYEKD